MQNEPLRIEICPNCSLSVRGARLFFVAACIAPFGIAGFLALRGFWPILPFAGLEMALLAWALAVCLERRFHSQTITVTEDDVHIERARSEHREPVCFEEHWSLQLRLHGKYCRVKVYGSSMRFKSG